MGRAGEELIHVVVNVVAELMINPSVRFVCDWLKERLVTNTLLS